MVVLSSKEKKLCFNIDFLFTYRHNQAAVYFFNFMIYIKKPLSFKHLLIYVLLFSFVDILKKE